MIPIPVPTNGRTYAAVFVVFLFFWPLFLFMNITGKRHPSDPTVTVCVLITIMIASYVLNYVRCSSSSLSYWGGLCVIAGFWRSGCVQITAFVISSAAFFRPLLDACDVARQHSIGQNNCGERIPSHLPPFRTSSIRNIRTRTRPLSFRRWPLPTRAAALTRREHLALDSTTTLSNSPRRSPIRRSVPLAAASGFKR
jgi:hypothetical protein